MERKRRRRILAFKLQQSTDDFVVPRQMSPGRIMVLAITRLLVEFRHSAFYTDQYLAVGPTIVSVLSVGLDQLDLIGRRVNGGPPARSGSYHLLRRPSSVAQGLHNIQLVQNKVIK